MATAPKPPPPPPSKAPPPAPNSRQAAPARSFGISRGTETGRGKKIVIFGPGGVGKSTLAALLSNIGIDPLFLDIDEGTDALAVARVSPTPETFEDVRAILQGPAVNDFGGVVLDSATKAEEYSTSFVCRTVPHEKGKRIESIEDYGFGKGFTHVYEAFLLLLSDLDALTRKGKHVVLIAHECVANVPNPSGEDWIRYEPRLQSPASGKFSIRHRVKEWCDHLLFIGYDVAVEDGKGKGAGTRCIYPNERPECMAKSRTLDEPIPYHKDDAEVWRRIFNK